VVSRDVLVIGGGVAGIQAALDLGDMGLHVHLVEKKPSIGGRMAQLDKTFPTNDCSICILAPKMAQCSRHPNITLHTYSEVTDVTGSAGEFSSTPGLWMRRRASAVGIVYRSVRRKSPMNSTWVSECERPSTSTICSPFQRW